jgi:hypothetical protein
MKNLRKTLASIAIMAALVAGCQTNSPTPEVVVVKKPDPITPADTTKKDTTKVVVIPPTPVSPKVIAGQKCYEGRVVAGLPWSAVVVQVLNDSIGVTAKINVLEPDGKVGYKEFSNIVTLAMPNWNVYNDENSRNIQKVYSSWRTSGKVYFTVEKFETLQRTCMWGYPVGANSSIITCFDISPLGVIVSSYSTQSCKP